MEDDEVADVLEQVLHLLVIFVALDRVEALVREERDQLGDAALDEMDAGRFERLDEAARQAHRDDVAVPGLLAAAGGEGEAARVRERLALEIVEQHPLRLVVADMRARIDVAVAHPVLQRDSPLPAGFVRGGAGEGIGIAGIGGRDGDGAVAGQPVRPILIAGFQLLLDQQAAKARAIDEQVARDLLAVGERHRFDEAVSRAQRGVDDLALDPPDAARLGIAAQEFGVERGIEVEGVE